MDNAGRNLRLALFEAHPNDFYFDSFLRKLYVAKPPYSTGSSSAARMSPTRDLTQFPLRKNFPLITQIRSYVSQAIQTGPNTIHKSRWISYKGD